MFVTTDLADHIIRKPAHHVACTNHLSRPEIKHENLALHAVVVTAAQTQAANAMNHKH
jgi:hypothetical protein